MGRRAAAPRTDCRCGTCRFWQSACPPRTIAGVAQGQCRLIRQPPFWLQPFAPTTLATEGAFCAAWRTPHAAPPA